MRSGSVRAGALLFGAASLLAVPGIASGQVSLPGDAGKTVDGIGKAVPQVSPPQAPQVRVPAPVGAPAPSRPAPRQAPSSAPAPSAPSTPSSGSGSGGGGGSTSSGSGSAAKTPASGGAKGAKNAKGAQATLASKSKKAGASGSSGSSKDGAAKASAAGDAALASSLSGADTGSFTAGAQPSTGGGDSRLPFTGFGLLLVVAAGGLALLGGFALRSGAGRASSRPSH